MTDRVSELPPYGAGADLFLEPVGGDFRVWPEEASHPTDIYVPVAVKAVGAFGYIACTQGAERRVDPASEATVPVGPRLEITANVDMSHPRGMGQAVRWVAAQALGEVFSPSTQE
jgi:hypothetical protein